MIQNSSKPEGFSSFIALTTCQFNTSSIAQNQSFVLFIGYIFKFESQNFFYPCKLTNTSYSEHLKRCHCTENNKRLKRLVFLFIFCFNNKRCWKDVVYTFQSFSPCYRSVLSIASPSEHRYSKVRRSL